MRAGTFFKGIAVGAVVAVLTVAATSALAGSGIGGIFNLGVTNTVDAKSTLTGNHNDRQLNVINSNAGAGAIAIGASSNGAAPTIRADSTNNTAIRAVATNLYGLSATSVNSTGVFGGHTGATGADPGFQGDTSSTSAGAIGVLGRVTPATPGGNAAAVRGQNLGTNGNGFGVFGSHSGGGVGVKGQSATGIGVQADSAGTAAALRASNTGGGPAANLLVNAGIAPLMVNSDTKVDNLNADKLDGLHANELARIASAAFDFPTVTFDVPWATVTVTTTQASEALHVTSNFYVDNPGGDDPGNYPCDWVAFPVVDGASDFGALTGWHQPVPPPGEVTEGIGLDHVYVVGPGTHTIGIAAEENQGACTILVGRGSLTVEAIPFGGDGAPPTAPTKPQRPAGKPTTRH